jgi:hypothetical protein
MTETEPGSETSYILQVPKTMDSAQHNVCMLLGIFVQIMWRGLQCSARGWEPSPVRWISKATLLIKCYSRPHLLRTNRHWFPTSSPLCKITHSGLLRLMVNFVVCPTAPYATPQIGNRFAIRKCAPPYWRFIDKTFCHVLRLSLGQQFTFLFVGQFFLFFEYC